MSGSDVPPGTMDPAVEGSMVRDLFVRVMSPEFVRYFGASVVALAVDTTVLLALSRVMHYTIAAAIGFLVGSLVHYVVVVRFVFRKRRLEARRWLEATLFVTIGIGALVANVSTIALCVEWLGAPLLLAKMVAAGVSFLLAYGGRKAALFV